MTGRITFVVSQDELDAMMPEGCSLLDVVPDVEAGTVLFICKDSRPGAQKWWRGLNPFRVAATMKGTLNEVSERTQP